MWNELTFAWQSAGLGRLLDGVLFWGDVLGALGLVLWMILLRRRPSGIRTAAGLLAVVLLPNAVLAGVCVSVLRSVPPVWLTLMLAAPLLSIAMALYAIGWTAVFREEIGQHECGRCRHPLLPDQSACAECGWARGSARGVRQAKHFALALLAGLSAFASLVTLALALRLPLDWVSSFEVELSESAPAVRGSALHYGNPVHMYGRSIQRMSAYDRTWNPTESALFGFEYEVIPGTWQAYIATSEDHRGENTAEKLAALEERLVAAGVASFPKAPRDSIERTARLQSAFVQRLFDRTAEPRVGWVRVEGVEMTPPPAFSVFLRTA